MARITHGDVGDVWVPQATFLVGGTPTDPTNITVKIKDPAGTISTLGPVSGGTGGGGIVRVSAGVFNTSIPITASGYWSANFTGTAPAAASEDHQYIADPSGFSSNYGLTTRALVGLEEAENWLNQQNVGGTDRLDLVRVINDVSDRMIEESGGREFKPFATNPATRTFQIDRVGRRAPWYIDGEWMGDLNTSNRRVRIGDLTSFTVVQIIDQSDWTTVIENISPISKVAGLPLVRTPWEPIRELEFRSDVAGLSAGMRLSVTGVWGFPTVPGSVRQATLDAIAATLDRDVEHYSQDQSTSQTEGGNVIVIGGGRQRLLSMPPSSLAVAWSYRDPWLA